jgi:serine phosphatase RsbU (regulator of sigma subunit)
MMGRNTGRFLLLMLITAAGAAYTQELYWENPEVIQAQGVRFSQSATGGGLIVVSWQELVTRANGQGDIFLSLAVSSDGQNWTRHERFYGPVPYSEPDPTLHPPVYSMIVDSKRRISMAVAVAERVTAIIVSDDDGKSFREVARLESQFPTVTPGIFASARGGYLLFVTQSRANPQGAGTAGEYLSIYSSVSRDGESWSAFSPFISEEELRYNFSPQHSAFHGKDFVVFQSRSEKDTFQLYLKVSSDGGRTWGAARTVTRLPVFAEPQAGKARDAVEYTNQRPSLYPVGASLGLVWERNLPGSRAQLYYCELADSGDIALPPQKVASTPESIYGQILTYRGALYVLYSDVSLAASRITLAHKGAIWDTQLLSRGVTGASSNPHAVTFGDKMLVFWETIGATGSSLLEVRPVTHVDPPKLIAVDFVPGKRLNRSAVSVRWDDPPDPAGIKTYHYTWSVDGVPKVQQDVALSRPLVALPSAIDGAWELSVTAEDFAGNVSPMAKIGYVRDTTPPEPVAIDPPATDANGFLASNTFSLSWRPPAKEEITGYRYGISFIGEIPREAAGELPSAPSVVQGKETAAPTASFDDIDDGAWAFSVSAVDSAGNIGKPATVLLKLDKFVPYTAVYTVAKKTDEFGNVTLSISGRGFDTGGTVEKIFLSEDGKPPYEYEFLRSRGDFTVMSDRLITGPRLTSETKSGNYVLALFHPVRLTTVWKGGLISFEAPGTIKIGNFSIRYLPGWVADRVPLYTIPASQVVVVVVVLFIAVLIVLSARKMVVLLGEGAMLREEVTALIEGRPSSRWEERNRKMRELQRRGAGLRLKYTLLMIVLVILIVLIVSVPLSFQMIGQQRTTLANGLRQRSEILVGSLASSAENLLRLATPAYEDMRLVPNNTRAMADALWATVTGPGDTDKAFKDYVWATNDPQWIKTHPGYNPATEKASDDIGGIIPAIVESLEADGRRQIEPLIKANDAFLLRYNDLSQKTDKKSAEDALAALNVYTRGQREIDTQFKTNESFAWVHSSPDFRTESLPPTFVFYKPIVYFSRAKDAQGKFLKDNTGSYIYSYFQGMVRLAVSTKLINLQIVEARNTLIRITGLISLLAIALGVLGAILLASITVTPIKKLAAGVAIIRDTEDKEELKSHTIEVRTRDEIGMLADTVNDMTKGLVKAAIANKELMVGKDVQKMFLPLEKDSTTGGEETALLEIYGYYEGQKGVSGDYFDFKKLDDTHYAIIKCDVAGHGVPAALIMVEVATLFISYFRDWVKRKDALAHVKDPTERLRLQKELERVDTLVYTINDMIEERGFKGRFAALTICLFNAETGAATVCNAGDRLMHIYDADQRKMVNIELPDAPAAGVFSSMLFDMKRGFRQITQKLDPGDVIFLYTDGFDEAKRFFRNESYEIVSCDEPGLKEGEIHLGTHSKGQNSEEFGSPRMESVIDAVFNSGRYSLVRHHSPTPGEELVFDFSTCQGTVKEAVLALVAVERVFRAYRDPAADANSRIIVDSNVDAFLKDHFLQYSAYFTHRLDGQGVGSAITFTHLHEDEQSDDLTMLVLKKK